MAKNKYVIWAVLSAITIAFAFFFATGGTYLAYPVSSASIGYYCSAQGEQIVCSVTQDQFFRKGLDAQTGIGFNGLSTLYSQLPNAPNKCKAQITIGGGECYSGTCVPGCGLNGQCVLGSGGTNFDGMVEGEISGDSCVWNIIDDMNVPCCFGEWTGGPPSVWGTVYFYYEEPIPECVPALTCGDWSDCISNMQYRNCDDGCGFTDVQGQACLVEEPEGSPTGDVILGDLANGVSLMHIIVIIAGCGIATLAWFKRKSLGLK
jgi:hypothetical protein